MTSIRKRRKVVQRDMYPQVMCRAWSARVLGGYTNRLRSWSVAMAEMARAFAENAKAVKALAAKLTAAEAQP